MKTSIIALSLMLLAMPWMTGCEGESHGSVEYVEYGESEYAAVSVDYAPVRYDYFVRVAVYDPWGYPLPSADVEVVVADVPEYSVYSTTDGYGLCDFWVEVTPGVVLSVFVDDYEFGGNYVSVVTDEITTEYHIDVRL